MKLLSKFIILIVGLNIIATSLFIIVKDEFSKSRTIPEKISIFKFSENIKKFYF